MIGLADAAEPGGPCNIGESPVSVISVEDRLITRIHSREKEVEVAVVIEVAKGRGAIRFPKGDAALSLVFEVKTVLRAAVPQEPGLRLAAVREVAGEQVDQPVVVEVAPGRTDAVAVAAARAIGARALGETPLVIAVAADRVVDPELVRLQPVVGHIDVHVVVLVEIARRGTA